MVYKCNLEEFKNLILNRKVICFGAGIQGQRFPLFLKNWNYEGDFLGFIDNNKKECIVVDEQKYPTYSFMQALNVVDNDTVVVITCLHSKEIIKQIKENEISKNWFYISIDEVAETQLMISDYPEVRNENEGQLIPKIIHYAWFGGRKSSQIEKNIERWKELCIDYEFKEWNENTYDITTNAYMKQAYETKSWGFVPDYLRLDVIYKYGGIYLDTDIELIRKPDELLFQKCFASIDASLVMNLGSGFGAVPGCNIIKELRDYYDNVYFLKKDGKIDKTSCNTHSLNVIKNKGFLINDSLQNVNGMNIYPMIFQGACQYTGKKRTTEKTFWIHHGNMSWM